MYATHPQPWAEPESRAKNKVDCTSIERWVGRGWMEETNLYAISPQVLLRSSPFSDNVLNVCNSGAGKGKANVRRMKGEGSLLG